MSSLEDMFVYRVLRINRELVGAPPPSFGNGLHSYCVANRASFKLQCKSP